ncbi:MAG: DUF2203 domain-containing protein [Phycisphaeraceae bacterium]|nr:DUF2203 domain-containing protein [Phycisphaeraceae bacterium]
MLRDHLIHPPLPDKKYFSIEEANRALPYASRIIHDVREVYRHIVELRRNLEHTEPGDGSSRLERDYESSMDRLSSLIDELHTLGVELKDFEKGLIDFPCVYEDREICLSWRSGDKAIRYWHEIDDGYAGRRDIATLAPAPASTAA